MPDPPPRCPRYADESGQRRWSRVCHGITRSVSWQRPAAPAPPATSRPHRVQGCSLVPSTGHTHDAQCRCRGRSVPLPAALVVCRSLRPSRYSFSLLPSSHLLKGLGLFAYDQASGVPSRQEGCHTERLECGVPLEVSRPPLPEDVKHGGEPCPRGAHRSGDRARSRRPRTWTRRRAPRWRLRLPDRPTFQRPTTAWRRRCSGR